MGDTGKGDDGGLSGGAGLSGLLPRDVAARVLSLRQAGAVASLVLDAGGRRLAKRDRAATLREMRAAGIAAAEVLARAEASR